MRVFISVTRRTEYAKTIDIPKEEFERLESRLLSTDPVERFRAEREIDGLMRPDDWQDDEVLSVNEFDPAVEEDSK